ncbi:hypothetical protein EK21DRAFT_84216 [Setomelanomma holmii]|uniref:DNA mismatch repair protein S5 domain-containing protein n=1 Tax=Setomelanomma holmii TaxID=210430 RepID=A0A9P4HMR1_9PLEO|nr:hypothetical protein EK21DRAFT_84216 [Setomelanomma holmii]
MVDPLPTIPLPGIAALSLTTARQVGSGQVLVDTASVVKDDGHGIPAEDHALAFRRYYTSKIREFKDLTDVGGRWLGFRGEALSSMAEMSGTLTITTRVEHGPVAVKLKYDRNVGTTVKATQFFDPIPVRKLTATKNSAKYLVRIRRLMQAYALARPVVRFRLHVLKAKNNKGDFIYALKASANIEDAVLKVIGKDCALQFDWTTLESDGFELHAYLPKPTAIGSKIANHGTFISIDSRPVSNNRGTIKQVVGAFKKRLRRSNSSLANVTDPFCCINIMCPPGSYDPNIEPAKDDFSFENSEVVLNVVDKLLKSYYPETTIAAEDEEPPTSARLPQATSADDPFSVYEDALDDDNAHPTSEPRSDQPRWRSSMYGIDEDDLEHLQENHPPVIEDEEGSRSAAVSNPWTIARMNASVKPRRLVIQQQLLSPAKSQDEEVARPSSPALVATPGRVHSAQPLTPQTSLRMNVPRSFLDLELERSIRPLPQAEDETMELYPNERTPLTGNRRECSLPLSEANCTFSLSDNAGRMAGPPQNSSNQSTSRLASFRPQRMQLHTSPSDTFVTAPRQRAPQARDTNRASSADLDSRSYGMAEYTPLRPEVEEDFTPPRTSPSRAQVYHNGSTHPMTPRAASVGSERPSLALKRSQEVRTALDLYDRQKPSNNAHDIASYFQAYQERELASPDRSASPVRRQLSRVAPMHETASNSRPQRRRRTDGAHRTKSSKLPLERVPYGYHVQNLIAVIRASLISVVQASLQLDMGCNSFEWSYSAEDPYDDLAGPVTDGTIMGCVIELDTVLHELRERMPGVDTRSLLHEGIQRGLDVRNQEQAVQTIEVVDVKATKHNKAMAQKAELPAPGPSPNASQPDLPSRMEDEIPDFDMSQFVDFDVNAMDSDGPPSKEATKKAQDDFGDDIDDDMLMDLQHQH